MTKNYRTNEIPLRVHGRTDGRAYPIPLFWTGAAVEIHVTGSALSCTYESHFGGGECYVRVEIDGADMYRLMLEEGRHTVPLFRGFPADAVKNVRLYRENQASGTSLAIESFTTDGEFQPIPIRKRIEFFGDSITSGEGLAGAQCLNSWIPAVFSCRNHYAIEVARALDWDYSIVSQSGWGVYCGWDNSILSAVPTLYEAVCGAAKDPVQVELGAQKPYRFPAAPDITAVFLGANDNGAFYGQGWVGPDGVTHRQRLDENGRPVPEDLAKVETAICRFLGKIRAHQPSSTLLWCARDFAFVNVAFVRGAVQRYMAETGDTNVHVVEMPLCPPETNGSRSHPGPEAHRQYAEAILQVIREIQ